jgi:hypothetical protein
LRKTKLKIFFKKTLVSILQGLLSLKLTNVSKPKGVISILEMLAERNAVLLGEFPKENIIRKTPGYSYTNINYRFVMPMHGLTNFVKATMVVSIANARVYSSNGIVVSGNRVVKEFSHTIGKTIDQLTIYNKIILPIPYKIKGRVLLLSTPGADINYFHWMMDLIPRLRLFEKQGLKLDDIDYVLLGHKALAFQLETLNLLKIKINKIINLNQQTHVYTKDLIVPSFVGLSGNMPKSTCLYLRDKFIKREIKSTRKIYISRINANSRKIINEEDLIKRLVDKNFEIIRAEKLSFSEQVELFQSAKIVISPHGAGLTNITFCNPNTTIIEIFSPNYINQCFWTIASHCDLNYNYYLGEGIVLKEDYTHNTNQDIKIDTDKFITTFENII